MLTLPSGERIALTTDSFVVRPLRFPGGSIGHLAVHGTVNDLAVDGRPARSGCAAAFVLEEGFPVAELRGLADDMADAARGAGVALVTGDTKVVDKGAADGAYITTAGVGVGAARAAISAPNWCGPATRVLVSGTIGDHGMAVMLAPRRPGAGGRASSRTPPRWPDLVEALLAAAPSTRWLRDPTRGGVGTVANELGPRHQPGRRPRRDAPCPSTRPWPGRATSSASTRCTSPTRASFWPWSAPRSVDAALAAMRGAAIGADAAVIGEIRAEPEGIVVLRTAFGGTRIVDMLVGDPLPRIC